MTVKQVFAPHLGRHVKLGRVRPRVIHPHLKLRNYLRAALPTPPSSCDFSTPAAQSLRNVYLNDQLGCCVIAGANHIQGTETGNAGAVVVATDQQITAQYSAIGGYVPGNPSTDQGCDMQTALAYYCSTGFANGKKLLGYLAVDATNQQEVMAACWLFENLYHAFELPDAWINPFPSSDGFVWDDSSPDPENGHCVMSFGYDARGVKIDTWALYGTVTWKALAHLGSSAAGGELYVMLSPEQLAKGASKAPNGVDWSSLLADWDALGGTVPQPAPAPSPAPAPTAPPSLAQAAAAVSAAFAAGPAIYDRGQAISVAAGALSPLWPSP